MKIKLFTHTDLDGASCAIVLFNAFGEKNVDVTYCDYDNVNHKINDFVMSEAVGDYDIVFITDISVNEQVAGGLDALHSTELLKVVLLDHHDVDWLNEYDWATVEQSHSDERPSSGATLLFEYLFENGHFEHLSAKEYAAVMSYSEHVRMYDTWEWVDLDVEPNNYNTLFWFYGRDRWVSLVMERFLDFGHYAPSANDRVILEVLAEQVEKYVEKVEKNMVVTSVGKYRVGVVFAEQHINDVAHGVHDKHPDLDLIAVVNMESEKISYRTNKDNIDVGQFARYFGGGGRKATAGSELNSTQMASILHIIFDM